MGRVCDATPRESSLNGSGVATAIPLDRLRDGVTVLQQLGDADTHIAAGEMIGASASAPCLSSHLLQAPESGQSGRCFRLVFGIDAYQNANTRIQRKGRYSTGPNGLPTIPTAFFYLATPKSGRFWSILKSYGASTLADNRATMPHGAS